MNPNHWLKNGLKWLLLACASAIACVAVAQTDPAAALRTKYAELGEQLRQNQFKRPLMLESVEQRNGLKGDIYGVVDYPFDMVKAALNNPDHWCDVMILHINTKYCRAVAGSAGTTLKVNIGKKTPEELVDVAQVDFVYRVAASRAWPRRMERPTSSLGISESAGAR